MSKHLEEKCDGSILCHRYIEKGQSARKRLVYLEKFQCKKKKRKFYRIFSYLYLSEILEILDQLFNSLLYRVHYIERLYPLESLKFYHRTWPLLRSISFVTADNAKWHLGVRIFIQLRSEFCNYSRDYFEIVL